MMKKFITNLCWHSENSTAMIVQNMVTDIAVKEGYYQIDINSYKVTDDTPEEMAKRIDGMIAMTSADDMVVVQVPTWNGITFDKLLIERLRSRVKKIVVFIHDFVPLMFENNRYLMVTHLNAYNQANLIVVPSKKMGDLLVSEGLKTDFIVQDIWDHVTADQRGLGIPEFKRTIKFAGNMSRFPFVKDWSGDVPLEVYSWPNGDINSENVVIKGWMRDYELLHSLNDGGFGLVWSENIDNQAEREYSTMNSSSKLSSYLAAGLPLIVNEGLSKQNFIEKYGLGFVVSSLEEANERVKNISEQEYNIMAQNVDNVSRLVREGFFTRKLLVEMEQNLFL